MATNNKGKIWLKVLEWVSSSLEGIEHVFVKLLMNPSLFTDIDVLIPDENEREKALKALGGRERFSRGAILEGSGRFILRLRLVSSNLDIDIYPNTCWGGLKVADGREIVERRTQSRTFGIKLEVPSPDDSFYLIATHAYSHLKVRWEELENCRRLSLDPGFDIGRVIELAKSYGMKPIIATFCNALEIDTGIECDCIEELKLKKAELSHEVKIPKSFVLRSFHTHELSGKASLRELASDFAWHLVRPLTKSMGFR